MTPAVVKNAQRRRRYRAGITPELRARADAALRLIREGQDAALMLSYAVWP